METISDSVKVSDTRRRSPLRRGATVTALILLSTSLVLTGCGRRSVVGRVANATTSAVSGAANVAGAAVSTTANVAGAAVSTTANVAGAAASTAGSAVGGATGAAAGGTAAGASSGVLTPAVVGAGLGVAGAAALDNDNRTIDSAAMAEGTANCLQAGPNPTTSARLLAAAGWADAGMDSGMRVFTKNNVRGLILPEGHCTFRSEWTAMTDSDPAIRTLVNRLYPGSIKDGSPSGSTGQCDGFTVTSGNRAWVHYTSSDGTACGTFGSGVTVQFL